MCLVSEQAKEASPVPSQEVSEMAEVRMLAVDSAWDHG